MYHTWAWLSVIPQHGGLDTIQLQSGSQQHSQQNLKPQQAAQNQNALR